jgi:hypothetical protein
MVEPASWVYRNGELVEKGGPKDIRPPVARADMPCPMLISDSMNAAEHVDGKFYTSKSEYRRVTKANGLIEVGNDTSRFKKPGRANNDKAIEQSIDRAIARVS